MTVLISPKLSVAVSQRSFLCLARTRGQTGTRYRPQQSGTVQCESNKGEVSGDQKMAVLINSKQLLSVAVSQR